MVDQDTLRLKPADGRRVRKPDGSLLAAGGEDVTRDPFWIRRLDAGDVEETAEISDPAAKPAAKTKD